MAYDKELDKIFGKGGAKVKGKQLTQAAKSAAGQVTKAGSKSAVAKGAAAGAVTAGKAAGGSALGKTLGPLGAGGYAAWEVKHNLDIAKDMEEYNKKIKPVFSQDDINYYKNKAKTIGITTGAGTGIGAGLGAIGGLGFGAAPGAVGGLYAGSTLGELGYALVPKPKNEWNKDYKKQLNDLRIAEYLNEKNTNQQKPATPTSTITPGKTRYSVPSASYPNSNDSYMKIVNDGIAKYGGYDRNEQYPSTPQQPQMNNIPMADPVNNLPEEHEPYSQADNSQAILNYYTNLSNRNNEYIKKLNDFYNNYDNNLEKNIDRQMYFNALAGWTGNDRWSKMGEYVDPMRNEATKLELYKQLLDAQSENDKGVLNMAGNLALMKKMGLDPSMAMADPKTFSSAVSLMKTQQYMEGKKEIAKLNNIEKDLDRRIRWASKVEDLALARELTKQKNDISLQRALITGLGFGADPTTMYNALNSFGYNYTPIVEE